MRTVLPLLIEKKTLLFTFAVMSGLSVYRGYHFGLTGFFVADEFGYAYNAIHGDIYDPRWFFGLVNSAIFRVFNVTTVDKYSLFLPFYLIFWSWLTLYVFYLLMKALDYDGMTIALSLFSSLFIVSFVLLSLGFLTEPVGLALALLASLFLVRFAKRKSDSHISLLYPMAAALCYVAATYTREPYAIFLILGVIAVFVGARSAKGGGSEGRRRNRVFLAASIIAFVVPSAIFLYPNHHIAGPIAGIAVDFANLFSDPSGIRTPAATANSALVYSSLPDRFLNTSKIFAFGMVLGWGPLLIGLFLFSFLLMLRRVTILNRPNRVVLTLSFLALASYLIVSFIFSPDPTFLTYQNYSTIIRFSDTALPAYFLVAPVGISMIAGRKNYRRAMVALLLVFLLIAVPAYEIYASSNLAYAGENPFPLGYRTPAAQIRDYISAHQSEGPFNIVGIPSGWLFTPGVEDLHDVQIFAPSAIPTANLSYVGLFYEQQLIPYLSYSEFVQKRWPAFYVYGGNITGAYDQNPGYAIQFINPNAHLNLTNPQPFVIVSRQVILTSPNTVFIKIQLSWK